MSGAVVEVRPGQLWEFRDGVGARRARVVRITNPIDGVRYVFLERVGVRKPMRTTLRRLQQQCGGARLLQDVVASAQSKQPMRQAPPAPPASRSGVLVYEPRMSAADRRATLADVRERHTRGEKVDQIADEIGVSPEVVRGWLETMLE